MFEEDKFSSDDSPKVVPKKSYRSVCVNDEPSLHEEEEDEEEDVEEVARCMVRGAGDGGSKRTRSWGGKAATMA